MEDGKDIHGKLPGEDKSIKDMSFLPALVLEGTALLKNLAHVRDTNLLGSWQLKEWVSIQMAKDERPRHMVYQPTWASSAIFLAILRICSVLPTVTL